MFILLAATAVVLVMMVVCKSKPVTTTTPSTTTPSTTSSEHFTPYLTQSDYPRLIYDQPPMLPPGSLMGLNYFPPAPAPTLAAQPVSGTDLVTPIDATLDTPNPIWLAGKVNWSINL